MTSTIELFPLDVVVVGEHGHAGFARDVLLWYLETAKAVRNFGLIFQLENGSRLALEGKVNTIIVSPHHVSTIKDLKKNAQFILRLRKLRPEIVFILNVNNEFYKELCEYNNRFQHYFRIDRDSMHSAYESPKERVKLYTKLDNFLLRCQKWHYGLYKYDVAMSFAGDDRKVARSLARHLEKLGSRVFFDEFEDSTILGKDLYSYLREVYSEEARYCCLLIWKAYAEGMWTSHERQAAQERALKMRGREYIIPIRIDGTPLPGFMDTITYTSVSKGVVRAAHVIHEKLWLDPSRDENRPAFFDRQTIG